MDETDFSTVKPEGGKSDSFYGDRSVVMSARLLASIKANPLINNLYITDIGFYPHAKNHFRRRDEGIDEYVLIYCIDGSGTVLIDGQEHRLTPNTCFIIPAGQPHAYLANPLSPWSIYWLHFAGERAQCFSGLYSRVTHIKPCVSSRIDDRIKLFNEIITALELGFSKENIEFANMCLNTLLATFFYVETFRSVRGVRSSDPVDQAIFFMQDNLHESLKISDIARHVQFSESHLSRLFRNKTGSSPMDYFINLKMQEAIRLLTNKNLKIKEVAFALGYDDPFYFSRIFSRHMGSSPGTFVRITKNRTV
jgi:AraC family transcriptional regulator, arabinose operon regulatory protein